MIFPKCYNGSMVPMVTASGFLHPCCQTGDRNMRVQTIDGDRVENPFFNPAFSLHNHTYEEIIESKEWNDFIGNIKNTKVRLCNRYCGDTGTARNSPINSDTEWEDTRVFTRDIDVIQFETTNRCILECPYCARYGMKKKQPEFAANFLNKEDLDIKIVEDVLTYRKWKIIIDCGTYGDPIYYKHYHEMAELISVVKPWQYTVSIAATGKTQKWWDRTHEAWEFIVRSGINLTIMWGIDGLEDTSNKHRVNQDWDEITTQMRRAATYKAWSTWQFIPMSFNEHQIEEAKQLAKDWDVIFYLKPSDRFVSENDPNRPSAELHYNMEIKNGIFRHTNTPRKEQYVPRVHIQR